MKFTTPPNPDPYGLDRFGGEGLVASLIWLGLIALGLWMVRRRIMAPTKPLRKWVRETFHIPTPGYLSKRNAQGFRDMTPAPNAGVSRHPADQGVKVSCKWARHPGVKENVLTRWRCAACGADGYSSDGTAPKECKQGIREGVL